MIKAVAFPGQGVQALGMHQFLKGRGTARLFEEASDLLGYNLEELLTIGPEEKLHRTAYAQPAVFVTCYALWELCEEHHQPVVFLGHSLGEITALVSAGAFSFADGVKLVAKRGELMEGQAGGMSAVLGLDEDELAKICADVSTSFHVQLANMNCPGQIVVSGESKGLELVEDKAREAGARRVVRLNVSGPFHTELMGEVAEQFKKYVDEIQIEDIAIPVISNHRSSLLYTAEEIRQELVEQLTSPVRFVDNVITVQDLGVDTLVEVSPKAVVGPLARRTLSTLQITLATPGGI